MEIYNLVHFPIEFQRIDLSFIKNIDLRDFCNFKNYARGFEYSVHTTHNSSVLKYTYCAFEDKCLISVVDI